MTDDDLQQIRAIVREETVPLLEALAAAETRSQEFARDIESHLLTAFHDYARGQQASVHRLQTSDADTAERLSALESRVLNLETRRPPQS